MTALHAELGAIVGTGAQLTDPVDPVDPVDPIAYGFDGTFFDSSPPLVVLPRTVEQVPGDPAARRPAQAAGRTNRVITIDPTDHVAALKPGPITAQLQASRNNFSNSIRVPTSFALMRAATPPSIPTAS